MIRYTEYAQEKKNGLLLDLNIVMLNQFLFKQKTFYCLFVYYG